MHLFAMEAREKLPLWRYHKGKDAFLFSPEEAWRGSISSLDEGGRKMEFSLNGRMLVDIERRGRPSEWLTLWALGVVRAAYG